MQAVAGKEVDIPETSFDVYDLAALAYIYKRIKETDPVREASHVVIDEAQHIAVCTIVCGDAHTRSWGIPPRTYISGMG